MSGHPQKYDFAAHYARMDDEDLIRLTAEYDSLVDAAREALDEEIERRNLEEARKALKEDPKNRWPDLTAADGYGNAVSEPHLPETGNEGSIGAGRLRYIGLTILLLLLAVSVSLSIFTLFSASGDTTSSEKAGESLGKQLIPWVAVTIWASAVWRGILRREANERFKLRHRRFGLSVLGLLIVLIASAVGLGSRNSGRISSANQMRKLAADIAVYQSKGAEFSRRLGEIRNKETPTYREYNDQCTELERLLNESEPVRAHLRQAAAQLRGLVAGDSEYRRNIDDVLALQAKDEAILTDLRSEIADSRQLMALPANAQAAYYSANIVPLQEEERRLAEEESSMMASLRARGVGNTIH